MCALCWEEFADLFLCCFAGVGSYFASPEDRKLLQQQKAHFGRLHDWMHKDHGIHIETTDGMQRLSHPPETEEKVLHLLRQVRKCCAGWLGGVLLLRCFR